jgi:polysaccharide biosynthesis/export protein
MPGPNKEIAMKQLLLAVSHRFLAMIALVLAPVLAMSLGTALPAAAQDYQIKSGDVLRIEVLEDASLNRSVLVAPDGRIALPLAGSLPVAGQSVEQVRAALTAALAPNFAASPTVYVAIDSVAVKAPSGGGAPAAAATYDVYVIGQVNNPGKFSVAPGTTILQFLAEIGGFTDFAAVKRIQLRRTDAAGKETVYILNYQAIVDGLPNAVSGTVAPGDVFVVPPTRLFE